MYVVLQLGAPRKQGLQSSENQPEVSQRCVLHPAAQASHPSYSLSFPPFPFFLFSLPSTPPLFYSLCFQAYRQVASIFSEACVTDHSLSPHLPDD